MTRLLYLAIFITLFSCKPSYKMELANPTKYGGDLWQGYFTAYNGKHIPFTMGIKDESMTGEFKFLYGRILSGENIDRSFIRILLSDSIEMEVGLHAKLLGKVSRNSIEGVLIEPLLIDGVKAPFILKRKEGPRFKKEDVCTEIDPTGKWSLKFDSLKDLSNNRDLLRYNIDRASFLDLCREGDNLLGKTAIAGEGLQSFDGIMTEKGFKMASFHHAEPFLIEATFTDDNHFTATITSSTDSYKVKGVRDESISSDVKYNVSVLTGIILFIKGFFKL